MPAAATSYKVAEAINSLGIDLLRESGAPGANALLSPYSVYSVLAMLYAGAEGITRRELAELLSVRDNDTVCHASLAELRTALVHAAKLGGASRSPSEPGGDQNDSITLDVANRLFGQAGYSFREPFLELMRDTYAAPFESLDFITDSEGAARTINAWVEQETQSHIRDLVRAEMFDSFTRLVLVNAVHLKALWADPFPPDQTRPRPFHLGDGGWMEAPTMSQRASVGLKKNVGFTVVVIPYSGDELQFVVFLPDEMDGLDQFERELTADLFTACLKAPEQEVNLHLPRLKIDPPAVRLRPVLEGLGVKTAFDLPPGSANFEGIAPRRADDYLYVSEGIHKAILELDEKGTVASAATKFSMYVGHVSPEPVEVNVDHPFLFAVQHRSSGVCLFLGRVMNPDAGADLTTDRGTETVRESMSLPRKLLAKLGLGPA